MQKKVLIVGPNFYGYNESVERAFIKLGFSTKVLPFLEKDAENVKEKISFHLTRKKEHFFHQKKVRFNKLFISVYDGYKPDILFIIKGSVFFPESIVYADKSINILWMMDSIFNNPNSYSLRKLVNHLFLFEKTDVDRLQNEESIKAHFLPLALDETVYYPINNSKKEIDILFVGALYKNRIQLLNRLIKHFPDKKIKIYGHFFSPLRNPLKFLFRKNKHIYTNKNVEPDQLNILYSQSKICLNIHHTQSVLGVNQRFFEILGSKSLEITDYKEFVANNFTQDDLLWYKNEDEMIQQIDKALYNYQQMESIKASGYKKVVEGHTFLDRIRYVLDVIK
ncbi:MAG: glycosyltransferase [Chitinophagaceae bacterium]|nr:glycosyltransferase [Chitinophagaceae bacterium]